MFKRLLGIAVLVVLIAPGLALSHKGEPTITVNLTLYDGNPVLSAGAAGAWDSMYVSEPRVIYHDGLYHMFFYGGDSLQAPSGIGYASSPDGITWTEYENNPILTPELAGVFGIRSEVTFYDGEQWVMLFSPGSNFRSPSRHYMRATAPAPPGPWTVDREPALMAGKWTEWDGKPFFIESVVVTDEGFALFYAPETCSRFGMATSPDGVIWTKYDNPETTSSPYADSDPVFSCEKAGSWAQKYVGAPVVRRHAQGYDLFHTGYGTATAGTIGIGYAYSTDGITWTALSNEPLIEIENHWAVVSSALEVDGKVYLYYTDWATSTSYGIGLVTGEIKWE